MIRNAWILALAGLAIGCDEDEPERSRFVPATPSQDGTKRAARVDAIPDATPPKNIATH